MKKDGKKNPSALKVQAGTEQPSPVNENAVRKLRRKPGRSPGELIRGILSGERVALAQAITLIESALPDHHNAAQQVLTGCLPRSGNSVRIGITGVPGAGKSTFIEAAGKYLTAQGLKLAVLAVDPSSSRSRGSILGDKVRMEELAADENAFIRPSPSAGTLGGVARKTWETIMLCEAAGYNVIFVETVGVGQSETAVHAMVDFFLLLMIPGAGDELQGIKRGIMEMADLIAINKADGDNLRRAEAARQEYQNALHLFPPPPSGWTPPVMCCSSLHKTGIAEIWEKIRDYHEATLHNGYFHSRRREQLRLRMHQTIREELLDHFYASETVREMIADAEKKVMEGTASAYTEALRIVDLFRNK